MNRASVKAKGIPIESRDFGFQLTEKFDQRDLQVLHLGLQEHHFGFQCQFSFQKRQLVFRSVNLVFRFII